MERAVGDGGPAPKRDLTGTWAGPGSGASCSERRGQRRCRESTAPPLTPPGKQLYERNKPIGKYSPGGTNDPHTRYCDPFGFPQNMTNEIRGMTIATMPNRTLILLQYMDLWREVWTDGRTLPTNVGGRGKDAHDPKYNGYSVGHWEDDYTFVVDTTGLAPETWATKSGYPHSVDAHVQERFHRDSKNDLTLNITMDDPKLYTKPFFDRGGAFPVDSEPAARRLYLYTVGGSAVLKRAGRSGWQRSRCGTLAQSASASRIRPGGAR